MNLPSILLFVLTGIFLNGENRREKIIWLNDRIQLSFIQDGDLIDSLKTFSFIKVRYDDQVVYADSTNREYFFDGPAWPGVIPVTNSRDLAIIPVFDAPDMNNLLVLTISVGKLEQEMLIPMQSGLPADCDGDGKMEFSGIMTVAEGYGTGDSCYYNPTLYYEITETGLELDSVLTISGNKKKWGRFNGFHGTDDIFPCERNLFTGNFLVTRVFESPVHALDSALFQNLETGNVIVTFTDSTLQLLDLHFRIRRLDEEKIPDVDHYVYVNRLNPLLVPELKLMKSVQWIESDLEGFTLWIGDNMGFLSFRGCYLKLKRRVPW
ncbi:MAG: hypothetical protein HUU10_14185 [Bacteroidetes bacterium]|nr:hypothetical protein [Bacteroidota bacterium]